MSLSPAITLYGFGPGFGLPEVSPYVCKTEVQLRMAGLAYQRAPADLAAAPKGKAPYVDDAGLVADSTFIRAHIEAKYGIDLDVGLDARQRAEAWAVERMLEDNLAWISAYFRWIDPVNFEKGPAHFFDDAPEAVREGLKAEVQAQVAANLLGIGVGRHSEPEILELARRSLDALSAILGGKPYLFGARPSGTDATALGVLSGILTPYFDSPLRDLAEAYPSLVAYVDRLMARFYPEFAWRMPQAA